MLLRTRSLPLQGLFFTASTHVVSSICSVIITFSTSLANTHHPSSKALPVSDEKHVHLADSMPMMDSTRFCRRAQQTSQDRSSCYSRHLFLEVCLLENRGGWIGIAAECNAPRIEKNHHHRNRHHPHCHLCRHSRHLITITTGPVPAASEPQASQSDHLHHPQDHQHVPAPQHRHRHKPHGCHSHHWSVAPPAPWTPRHMMKAMRTHHRYHLADWLSSLLWSVRLRAVGSTTGLVEACAFSVVLVQADTYMSRPLQQ